MIRTAHDLCIQENAVDFQSSVDPHIANFHPTTCGGDETTMPL